ncbi:lipopolysaccharide-induced tumor necrosis factor-alpha factor homolog isoform X1 [Salmo trutta]|uniref:lipopolysaccharide-induced tumor necrosis factor-alpha factor homolog isoform X1 n=1 Tax=Salmo trutta TaxID=8032 RepID=UPI00112FE6B0|nr:lipopolysaccharide-induced tumor necrosis factor-alpha factor homolog isoform X1 [Salmo trutta]
MANVQVPVGMSYCTLVAIGAFGDSPVQMTCPNCHQTVVTKVDFSSGVLTYLFCGGLFFCGFVLGCCLIPFCFDRLKDAKHTCPSCKTILGVYERL